jgi:hypothetical protein
MERYALKHPKLQLPNSNTLSEQLPTGDDTICPVDSSTELFPISGPNGNVVSSFIHSLGESESEDEGEAEEETEETDPEVNSLKTQKKDLLVAALGLAGLCAVLLICLLLFGCGRKRDKVSYAAVPTSRGGSGGGGGVRSVGMPWKPRRVRDPYDVAISPYESAVSVRN